MNKQSNPILLIPLILGVVAVIALGAFFLLSGLGTGGVIADTPEAARELATSILDYTLPDGFQEYEGLNAAVYKLIFITPVGSEPAYDTVPIIVIAAYPKSSNLTDEEVQDELRNSLLRFSEKVSTLETVGTEPASLRGETIELSVHESYGQYDPPVRLMLTPSFEGKSEKVVLVFAGPIEGWDQKMVNRFLSSIR
jgi:hypothetical protein